MGNSRLAMVPGVGHGGRMWRPLSIVGTWLTKIESWLALGGMVIGTGLFVWLGQQWQALADAGPAAVVLVAAVCASLVTGAISIAYMAVSQFRERRQLALDLNEHARALWSDGIPYTREQYMQYIRQGDFPIVNRFWSAGLANIVDGYGKTDLHYACEHGHAAIADELLRRGGDSQRADNNGHTPLMLAIVGKHTKVVERLLNHNCAINTTARKYGYSALFIAACHNHLHFVEMLLNEGADIDSVDHNNLTPLMAAIAQNSWDVAEYLVLRGANLKRTDAYGATIMDYALTRNPPDKFMQKLRDAGVEVAIPRLKGGARAMVGRAA
jgi:ankyrin repeat protein